MQQSRSILQLGALLARLPIGARFIGAPPKAWRFEAIGRFSTRSKKSRCNGQQFAEDALANARSPAAFLQGLIQRFACRMDEPALREMARPSLGLDVHGATMDGACCRYSRVEVRQARRPAKLARRFRGVVMERHRIACAPSGDFHRHFERGAPLHAPRLSCAIARRGFRKHPDNGRGTSGRLNTLQRAPKASDLISDS